MKNLSNNELLKELQKRLKKSDDLTEEVNTLRKEILDINQKLENSERFKSHFISNITNELVNPVASLLALSKFLHNTEANQKDKIERFSKLIYNETFDIDFQLKNIFFAAKFESGKFSIEKTIFCLKELTNSILTEFNHLLEVKNITIKLDIQKKNKTEEIISDSEKIKILLANLLSNSIRYSKNNDKVIITMLITENNLNVSFRDFGIGITPEFFDKVFERFYRIDNTINSENKGSGLGLSVSKQIVELLGGNIKFVPHENGSEISFAIDIETDTQSIDSSISGNEFFFDDDMEIF